MAYTTRTGKDMEKIIRNKFYNDTSSVFELLEIFLLSNKKNPNTGITSEEYSSLYDLTCEVYGIVLDQTTEEEETVEDTTTTTTTVENDTDGTLE